MPYEIVLPPDTQNEIETFIIDYFIGRASQLAAVDALDLEAERIRANPTLGVAPPESIVQTRWVHQFVVTVGEVSQAVEYTYRVNDETGVITILGFRRIPPLRL